MGDQSNDNPSSVSIFARSASRRPKDIDISITYLSEALSLNTETGELTWRERPLAHFINEHAWSTWNAQQAGKRAGSLTTKGYLQVDMKIDGRRRRLLAHRVVFALAEGRWPPDQLDHSDRSKTINKIENLREATNAQNQQNIGLRSSNTSGMTGVYWSNRDRRWRAEIKVNGRLHYCGNFLSKEDAFRPRRAAQARLHPFTVELPSPGRPLSR